MQGPGDTQCVLAACPADLGRNGKNLCAICEECPFSANHVVDGGGSWAEDGEYQLWRGERRHDAGPSAEGLRRAVQIQPWHRPESCAKPFLTSTEWKTT